jgi:hypothetical protein
MKLTVFCFQVRHSIKFHTLSPLASVDWYEATQTEDRVGTTDEILDILLALPSYLSTTSDQCSEFRAIPTHKVTTESEKSRLVNLLQRFNRHESRYLRECGESRAPTKDSDAPKLRLSDLLRHETHWFDNGGGDFCSFDVVTMLDSAMIIIAYLILSQHDAWSSVEQISYLEEQHRRSDLILLNADRTLEENPKGLNPGACLQFVFPLEVVAAFSYDSGKRDAAQSLLDRIGWARL